MSIIYIFTAGGIVMWPLLALSVLAIALIIERITFWVRIQQRQERVVRDVLNLYGIGNGVGAVDKLRKHNDLPLARIFLAALELEQPNPEEFRLALESEAQAELPMLKRFNVVFETIISLAPF